MIGQQISAHGNLNKGCLSVVPKGEKTQQLTNTVLTLVDCQFVVSLATHKRIVTKGHREVGARLKGNVENLASVDADTFANNSRFVEVTYNPKTHSERPYFYTRQGKRIDSACRAYVVTCESMETKAKTKAYIDA